MPLPLIPVLLGGASLIASAVGIKKGLDAKEDFDRAERIAENTKRNHERALDEYKKAEKETDALALELGKLRTKIICDQVAHIITFDKFKLKSGFAEDELNYIKQMIVESSKLNADISSGILSGTAQGILTGIGVYGSVAATSAIATGTLGAGTAVVATNAALAWLGGGALAAGGLGIAGGTAVLGGLVAGPALAIGGFAMANKAEKALTEAREYEAEANIKAEKAKASTMVLREGIQNDIKELSAVLNDLVLCFQKVRVDNDQDPKFDLMIPIGIEIIKVLRIPIIINKERNKEIYENLKSAKKLIAQK